MFDYRSLRGLSLSSDSGKVRTEAVSIPQVGLGFATFGYRQGFNRPHRNRSPISN